jgi:hypothetical protein
LNRAFAGRTATREEVKDRNDDESMVSVQRDEIQMSRSFAQGHDGTKRPDICRCPMRGNNKEPTNET